MLGRTDTLSACRSFGPTRASESVRVREGLLQNQHTQALPTKLTRPVFFCPRTVSAHRAAHAHNSLGKYKRHLWFTHR